MNRIIKMIHKMSITSVSFLSTPDWLAFLAVSSFLDVSSIKDDACMLQNLTLLPKCFYNYYICSVILIQIVILYFIFSAVGIKINLFSLSSSKSSRNLQEICNLSFVELPKFRKLNFYFNKFVNCNFSFTTLSSIHKQNILLLLLSLFFPISGRTQ